MLFSGSPRRKDNRQRAALAVVLVVVCGWWLVGRGGVGALQVLLLLLQYWMFKDSLETLNEWNVCSILHSQLITPRNSNTKLLKDLPLRKHRAFFYEYIKQNREKKKEKNQYIYIHIKTTIYQRNLETSDTNLGNKIIKWSRIEESRCSKKRNKSYRSSPLYFHPKLVRLLQNASYLCRRQRPLWKRHLCDVRFPAKFPEKWQDYKNIYLPVTVEGLGVVVVIGF